MEVKGDSFTSPYFSYSLPQDPVLPSVSSQSSLAYVSDLFLSALFLLFVPISFSKRNGGKGGRAKKGYIKKRNGGEEGREKKGTNTLHW
jgi:hypothetical protein